MSEMITGYLIDDEKDIPYLLTCLMIKEGENHYSCHEVQESFPRLSYEKLPQFRHDFYFSESDFNTKQDVAKSDYLDRLNDEIEILSVKLQELNDIKSLII